MDEKTAGVLSSFSLEGKVALVTGASYGIGFAIATALAEAGAKIAFNDRRQERIDSATAEYAKLGIEAHGFVADVTVEEQVAGLVENIREAYGTTPDILVNNAGIIKRIPMLEMSAADYRQVVDIDLVGPFICAKTPAGRWGTPEDLMGPAVFLASDASNFVNGHILYVDGGILAYIGKQPE